MIQWRAAIASLLATLMVPAWAASDEAQLLSRMGQALQTLEYEGVFVYVHDGRVETMRVVRMLGQDGPVERLVTLSGDRREVVNELGQVRCLTPGGTFTTSAAEHWSPVNLVAARMGEIREHYRFAVVGSDRVAGFDATVLDAAPRDVNRYAYRLWLDQASGMLLASTLREPNGAPVEQLVFTQLTLGAAKEAKPAAEGGAKDLQAAVAHAWIAPGLPAGFRLVAQPRANADHLQLVFSDGMASVSIYIEPPGEGLRGVARRGAVNAFGLTGPGANIVVVGDLPAATVARIAQSVRPRD